MNENNEKLTAQKICAEYTEKRQDDVDALRALDARVKRPANILAYTLGCVGALVMGAGMSLVMTDIGETFGVFPHMTVGIAVGIVGMLIAAVNYPIYRAFLSARRKKYAEKILALGNRIIND